MASECFKCEGESGVNELFFKLSLLWSTAYSQHAWQLLLDALRPKSAYMCKPQGQRYFQTGFQQRPMGGLSALWTEKWEAFVWSLCPAVHVLTMTAFPELCCVPIYGSSVWKELALIIIVYILERNNRTPKVSWVQCSFTVLFSVKVFSRWFVCSWHMCIIILSKRLMTWFV